MHGAGPCQHRTLKQTRRKSQNPSKLLQDILFLQITKHEFLRLREARFILQEIKWSEHHHQASPSALGATIARLWSPVVDDVAVARAAGRSRGVDGKELLQQ